MRSNSGSDGERWMWGVGFALALAIAYAALDGFSLVHMSVYQLDRPDVGRPVFNAAAFAGTYLMSLAALIALHCHASAGIRIATYAVVSVTLGVYYGFASVSARGFTVTEATLLRAETAYWPEAIRFHFWEYAPALAVLFVGIAIVERFVLPRLAQPRTYWISLAPLIAGVYCYHLLMVTDAKVDQFPIPFRVAALSAYAFNHDSVYVGIREDPYFAPANEPIADHIVLLLDESIRGDLLGINGHPLPTTPFLDSIRERLFNYGVASSVANLSAPSNIIMQSGLRPDELPDLDMRSMKNPNVFSYLARAGYYNVLINAQNALTRPPNFMTDAEIEALDEYLQIRELEPGLENHEPDSRVPAILRRIVAENERSFAYVIKDGAHFPYSNRYPADQTFFHADQFSHNQHPANAEIIAEYVNTVRYSADTFLQSLLPQLEATGKNVLVIYTSDHGQSLFETTDARGKKIRGHGHHVDPPVEQAMIPLVLLPVGGSLHQAIDQKFDPALVDTVSAFEFFSTFLVLAGYDEDELSARYFHSIFDRTADRTERNFVSGNHFGADGPLYRDSPYRSSYSLNPFDWKRSDAELLP